MQAREQLERELGQGGGSEPRLRVSWGRLAVQRTELEHELAGTQGLLVARGESEVALQNELGGLEVRLGELRASREQDELSDLEARLGEKRAALEQELVQAREQQASLAHEHDQTRKRAVEIASELDQAREQRLVLEHELHRAYENLAALEHEVAESHEQRATLEDELAQAHKLRVDYPEEVLSTFPPAPDPHAQAEPAGLVSEEAGPAVEPERAPEWRERDVVEHEAFAPGEPLGTESGTPTPMGSEATQSRQPAEPVVEEPERADVPRR